MNNSEQMRSKSPQAEHILVVLGTASYYGMERAVIETFSALRPELKPLVLLSHSTLREDLPQLRAVQERNLPHEFLSDTDHWAGIGKPKSFRHLLRMIEAIFKANRDVYRAARNKDAIYVPSVYFMLFALAACIRFRFLGKRVIFAFHDLYLDDSPWTLILKWSNPIITDYIYHTNLAKTWMTEKLPYLSSCRHVVIPLFVESLEKVSTEPFINHNDRQRNIVFLGQVSKHKGIDLLLYAFRIITCDFPDVHLHIIGGISDKEMEEEMENIVKEGDNPIAEKITYWGYQYDARRFLQNAYIHLQPSRPSLFHESFGRVAVEAMAVGVPTICFRSGALQEIVIHEVTGLICEHETAQCLADQMRRLLFDRAFRNELGSNARIRFESEFDSLPIKAKWLQLLDKAE